MLGLVKNYRWNLQVRKLHSEIQISMFWLTMSKVGWGNKSLYHLELLKGL